MNAYTVTFMDGAIMNLYADSIEWSEHFVSLGGTWAAPIGNVRSIIGRPATDEETAALAPEAEAAS